MDFPASEATRWKVAGYTPPAAAGLKALFSTPDEVKQFTTKYCKEGLTKGDLGLGPVYAMIFYYFLGGRNVI